VSARFRILLVLCALVFLVVHLASLPRALEDPDSINFALGVESFDVARHQPHPPGYPAYIALAKVSTRLVAALMPGWDRDRTAAVGLSVLSALAGAIVIVVLVQFWNAVGLPPGLAAVATLLTVVSPLFWVTSARPLTDVIGLTGALAVQTTLLLGWRRIRDEQQILPGALMLGALGAGLVPGLRSQTVWLVGPLAAWVAGELVWRRRWSHAGVFAGLVLIGGLIWFVPLVAFSNGLGGYLAILGAQGAEDFAGVEMLATDPSLKMLRFALNRTFLVPWQSPVLGQIIVVLAVVGAIRLARKNPGVLAGICLAFWPYVVFHLTFQETLYARYALPIVVPVAGLAVVGLAGLRMRYAAPVTVALAVVSLWFGVPDARTYASQISPLSQLARDMIAARPTATPLPALAMHHPLWWSSRRTFDWYRSTLHLGPQPFPGDREWLLVADHFRRGNTTPFWFLADPHRTDLTLIDRRAQIVRGTYGRPEGLQRLVGGDLLERVTWVEFTPPAWMLARGWALTPEVAGATSQDGRQPHRQPAAGWLRRAEGPHRLMIGGRYFGGGIPASLVVSIDGREIARATVAPSPVWWVQWFDLTAEALAGTGPYATLSVAVEAANGQSARPELGLEQFDFAPAEAFTYALADGWQELEQNPETGLSWRWSSEKNAITVFGGGRDVELTLAGESPLRYFDKAPTIRVSAGTREVARFEPAADFTESIVIPAALLSGRPETITIESDSFWVPAERSNSPDRRRLGLRLYRIDLRER
jgi:hypothetical protein